MPAGGNRLLNAVRRLAPPADGSDADLLGRFVAARDEAAFEALVRRHGPMVHAACRRELGPGPDADDAYQVAFLVLARDARRLRTPAALPGWLHRVARLSARKLRGRRRPTVEVRPDDAADPADPVRAAVGRELWAALDRELDALSDKLRAVFVLCCLEDRSSGEAARVLGCPVGTVESRLAAARTKLRGRLARRGFGLPAAGLAATAADGAAARLAPAAVAAAVSDAALTHPLTPIADGVTPMLSAKVKLLAAAGMTAVVFGTAGLGLVRVSADPAKPDAPPVAGAKPLPPPKKADAPPPAEAKPTEAAGPPTLRDERDVRTALARPAGDLPPALRLRDLLDDLHDRFGIVARLDVAEFKRLGLGEVGGMAAAPPARADGTVYAAAAVPEDMVVRMVMDLYEVQVRFPVARGLTVGDVLAEAVAQLPGKCRYRVRGNQVLIGPAFLPPNLPGATDHGPILPIDRMIEQIVGEPVSVALEDVTLVDAIKELRRLTGANIVLDARRNPDATTAKVSGTFDDTRLLTVLTVLADQCDLKPVAMNNVYYVTSLDNADRLQKGINRELFGEPEASGPAPKAQPK